MKSYKKFIEDIKIPIKVGDTVLGGRFKNKKIKVKDIGKNEKGDITINGRPLLKYRIVSEHPTIGARIAKKINPVEVIRDKLKTAKGATKRKLKKALDKVNPLSDINKTRTMAKKKDRAGLVKQRDGLKVKTKDVQNKIDKIDGVKR